MTAAELAGRIDHTLLKPEATPRQIDKLCEEALHFGFGAVCVNPVYVRRVAERLSAREGREGSPHCPAVCSVAGFPLGAAMTATKVNEARQAVDDGAIEIDMVAAIGALLDGDQATVCRDIAAVADAVHRRVSGGILKVILETGLLRTEQIILGCRCCVEAQADFVKTSTGFHACGGATEEHVRLLREHAAPLLVKASGGIRTLSAARAMIEAGAARIGTSAGVALIEELGPLDP